MIINLLIIHDEGKKKKGPAVILVEFNILSIHENLSKTDF